MGAFNIITLNFVEECFNRDLSDKLKTLFSTRNGTNEEKVIIEALLECSKSNTVVNYNSSDIIYYFDKIVKQFTLPNVGTTWKPNFSKEKHDRVKTKDNYRIENYAELNCNYVLDSLYKLYRSMKYDASYKIPKWFKKPSSN